jgi:hypothetical protein
MLQITESSNSSRRVSFTILVEIRKNFGTRFSFAGQMAVAAGMMGELQSEAQAHLRDWGSSYDAAIVSGGVAMAMPSPDTGRKWVYVLLPVTGLSFSVANAGFAAWGPTVLAALKGENLGNCFPFQLFLGEGDTRTLAVNNDQPVTGKGDPHLVNMGGQRFDLYQPGIHVLLQVPRRANPQDTLLRVEADARRMGAACADLYFQVVNITGSWCNQTGGLQFFASVEPDTKDWRKFGVVDIKVARGHTSEGISYLNVFVKHLGSLRYPVGGLLGEDDHTAAATPGPECSTGLDLHSQSPAVASFAVIEG